MMALGLVVLNLFLTAASFAIFLALSNERGYNSIGILWNLE